MTPKPTATTPDALAKRHQAERDEADAADRRRQQAEHDHPSGSIRVYESFDASAPGGGAKRDQLVMITGRNAETGHVYAKPLGWVDEGAQFDPEQLREVGKPAGDGGSDAGGG